MIPKYQKIIYLLFKKIILISKQIKTSMQVSYRMILSSSNFTIVLLVVRVQ